MRGRRLAVFIIAALALVAGTTRMTANSTRDRTISFYGVNTKETLTVQYMKGGKHIPEAMQKINWALRDWRKDEVTVMDPELIDLVWEIHAELGSAEPIHVISAYRSRATNDMLRRTVGGQASQSRHILGKAMDVHFPDVPVKKLRYSALIRERGGVGYYPTSATPFVHIDIDRVRAWPRLPRAELALLFPNGRTQHVPSDGGPITPDDVRRARAANARACARRCGVPPAAHAVRSRRRGRRAHATAPQAAVAAEARRAAAGLARGRATPTAPCSARSPRSRAALVASQLVGAGLAAETPGGATCVLPPPSRTRGPGRASRRARWRRLAARPRSCPRPPTTRSTPRSCPTARSR